MRPEPAFSTGPSEPAAAFSRQEGIALGAAVVAHVVLLAALTISNPGKTPVAPPERMTVTISDEIADQSTSPDPMAQPLPDVAPELGEPQAQPEPQPEPPAPVPPQPKQQPSVQPKPVAQPKPAPIAQKPKPAPAPARPAAQPAPTKPVAKPVAKPAAKPAAAAPAQRPGGSRIGNDFLKGVPSAASAGTSRSQPAATLGPAERSSLASAIATQLKRHWAAPQGADAEKLITILAWDLNPDGSLAGSPRVVRQEGITDANRAQAPRHAEQAVRAVRLAAPFDLPDQYYNGWKRVAAFRFDRKLSQ